MGKSKHYDSDRPRVLVISSEKDGAGIDTAANDCWRLAKDLAARHDVMLALPIITEASHPAFAVVYYNRRNISLLARDSDLVVCDQGVPADNQFFTRKGRFEEAGPADLREGWLPESDDLKAGAGSLNGKAGYLVWIPFKEKRGVSYYLGRARFHFETGGLWRTLSRGLHLVKRKIVMKP